MENKTNVFFEKRFKVKGRGQEVLFTFRIIHNAGRVMYKVRSGYPESDFDMQKSHNKASYPFIYSQPANMPEWITADDHLEERISDAIYFAEHT